MKMSPSRCIGIIVVAVCAASPALATRRIKDLYVAAGRPTLVWTYWNCVDMPLGGARGAFVHNGTISMREVTVQRCGDEFAGAPMRDVPGREVWYTPNPGFRGLDTMEMGGGPTIRLIVK
jgi:hypothetical protein